MSGFDAETLRALDEALEVRIETTRPDGTARSTIIWVVVDGGEAFVRSVRGDRGHWYQAAREQGSELALVVNGRRVPVRAQLADDAGSVERCSRALERKYATDPALPSMIRPETLGTTLRLEAA